MQGDQPPVENDCPDRPVESVGKPVVGQGEIPAPHRYLRHEGAGGAAEFRPEINLALGQELPPMPGPLRRQERLPLSTDNQSLRLQQTGKVGLLVPAMGLG